VDTKVSEKIDTTPFRVLLYTRTCNIMYAHTRSKTSPAPIFTKHAEVQQHCVQICYADFHLEQTVTVQSTYISYIHLHPEI